MTLSHKVPLLRALTSLILLGSTVGSVHTGLHLLLLQGVSLTTLRKAKNI
jgi:hypothetical protein